MFNKLQGKKIKLNRITVTATLLAIGWVLFEIFNFSTTEFALTDMLGDLSFLGMRWATVLGLAFCIIDFAGIARLFTPEQGRDEPVEVWYLFGAWVLAAAMNATLTWWAVSVAMGRHTPAASAFIGQEAVTGVVPVFVAILVWLVRILIIGTFALVGDRFFTAQPGPYQVRVHTPSRPSLPDYRSAPQALNRNAAPPRPAQLGSQPPRPPQREDWPDPRRSSQKSGRESQYRELGDPRDNSVG